MKTVAYTKGALKTLRGMPANVATLVTSKIDQYASHPSVLANQVTKLQGRSGYRLRVGDWRVIFTEDGTAVSIVTIGPRGSIYK